MVHNAAAAAARRELNAVLHTMGLEDQAVRNADRNEMLNARAAQIAQAGGRRLWGGVKP